MAGVCRLEVPAGYETDEEFGVPDIRRDCDVGQLKFQHGALLPLPRRESPRRISKVLRVDDIERMHHWADDSGRMFRPLRKTISGNRHNRVVGGATFRVAATTEGV